MLDCVVVALEELGGCPADLGSLLVDFYANFIRFKGVLLQKAVDAVESHYFSETSNLDNFFEVVPRYDLIAGVLRNYEAFGLDARKIALRQEK